MSGFLLTPSHLRQTASHSLANYMVAYYSRRSRSCIWLFSFFSESRSG